MKQKLYLLLLLLSCTAISWSQETRFGITGGLSIASWTAKASGVSINSQSTTGFTGGVIVFAPLSTNVTIQTGLNFVQKGAKTDDQGDNETIKLNYIELPVNFVYTHEGFFGGVGPTIAMGLSGTDKTTSQGVTEKADIHFGSGTDDDLKRFDIGANVTAGYMVPAGFMISLNYNFGLSNLVPGGNSSDGKLLNRYFGIRIGYVFNK
jgi:hypothetical protein